MAKLGQAQEQTMDEILASIRRIIHDEDVRKGGDPAGANASLMANGSAASPSPANVSRLFANEGVMPQPDEYPETDAGNEGEVGNVVELAMSQAMEEARAEVASNAEETEPVGEPEIQPLAAAQLPRPRMTETYAPAPRPVLPDDRKPARPLLSPRADAAVSTAFNQLASNMLSGSARTIDDLVEDMLRPMLRHWLDVNLPPLVERLVREEIERVSRGRR